MRFSVVVPTLGDRAKLGSLLEALARQTEEPSRWELILAADAPRLDPEIGARLESFPVPARVVPTSGGPGAGRNRGAAVAAGGWIAFTEDDCTPARDWLERAAAAIDTHPDIDVVLGTTLKPGGRRVHRQAGGAALYLPTNLFVRREVFERSGGYCERYFDPNSRVYFREDSDFAFVLETMNTHVIEAADAVVEHPEEHPRFLDPLRWSRRYVMDGLLAARFPRRFRERIEVHHVGPFLIRRPIVRASAGTVAALLASAAAALSGHRGLSASLLVVAAACLLVVWAKWRFDPRRLPVVPLVPFVLIAALARGWWRARSVASVER